MSQPLAHVVIIGRTDAGRRACSLLKQSASRVTHLDEPSDAELTEELADGVDGVAILLHDDIKALRYALVVHHLRPGVRLFVAMFDRTARTQVQRAVPGCTVLSPAAAGVPRLLAAVLAGQDADAVQSIHRQGHRAWVGFRRDDQGRIEMAAYQPDRSWVRRGWLGRLAGQLRPYDRGSAVLLTGVLGLVAVIAVDTALAASHEGLLRALYFATRTTATIAAPDSLDDGWHLAWATGAALLVMAFTAMFAAGLVNHLLSGRHVALLGRRVVPRSGHVIVVGTGQVGLRLAQELRAMGIAVLGIEQEASSRTLDIARSSGIPVLIGDGASRALLRRARVGSCLAIVAAGSQDRDNIAIAISALAAKPDAQVTLRAGMDDAIAETRSLFHIGPVVDVNGLTAMFVAQSMHGGEPYAVIEADGDDVILGADGEVLARSDQVPARCAC